MLEPAAQPLLASAARAVPKLDDLGDPLPADVRNEMGSPQSGHAKDPGWLKGRRRDGRAAPQEWTGGNTGTELGADSTSCCTSVRTQRPWSRNS